jgi:hypothetical protein
VNIQVTSEQKLITITKVGRAVTRTTPVYENRALCGSDAGVRVQFEIDLNLSAVGMFAV